MKIAITARSNKEDSIVDSRFGRCMYFQIYDTETKKLEVYDNASVNARGGAGIQSANFVIDSKVDALFTGRLGPNAMDVLEMTDINIYLVNAKTVGEIIEDVENDKLDSYELIHNR